jgi:type IV secretory pathway TrbL component
MRMRRLLLSVVVIVPVALWAGLAGAQSASSGQSSIHLSQAWARRAPMMGPAESGQGSMGSGHGSMGSGQSSMGSGQMHGQAGGGRERGRVRPDRESRTGGGHAARCEFGRRQDC